MNHSLVRHTIRSPALPINGYDTSSQPDGKTDSDRPPEIPLRAPIPAKGVEGQVKNDYDDNDQEIEDYRVEEISGHKLDDPTNEIL